jgi:hypothetical protein
MKKTEVTPAIQPGDSLPLVKLLRMPEWDLARVDKNLRGGLVEMVKRGGATVVLFN